MTEAELYSEVRELIGNPQVNEVSNRQLRKYLIGACEWLADQLKYAVVTDDSAILLVEDQVEYSLPSELCWIVWVEWNAIKLDPATTYGWEREGTGWRSTTASLPASFAVEGRRLLLNPPPSDDAIDTDSLLSIRYISNTPGLAPGGPPQMGAMDQQALIFKAAHRYCIAHPSDLNNARMVNYDRELSGLMARAKGRATDPVEDLQERFHVKTSRRGGAR